MASLKGGTAIRIFLCFAGAYLLSYAFRSVNAVIAPSLQEDVGLSNADLGLLSSAYFLSFACLQLPLGIWLDKYGPRRMEAGLLLIAAAGAAIFAMSTSLAGLWIGRALIGIGVSACLMAPFKAFRLWYPADRQSQLASWMLVAGTSGALLSTVPVSAMMPVIGWRGIFWIMTLLVLVASVAIFHMLKKVEAAYAATPLPASTARQGESGYRAIFRNPYFRRMGLLALISSGSFNAMHTLWAGPWMTTVLDMSKTETANVLFMFNLCLMMSYMALSWWAPRLVSHEGKSGMTIHRAIALGLCGAIVVEVVMLAVAAPWTWICWLLLAVCLTVTTLVQVNVGLSFPVALVGRANSAYNLLVFSGAFLMQWTIGLMSDGFQALGLSPAAGLRAAFGVCVLLQAAALFSFMVNKAQPERH